MAVRVQRIFRKKEGHVMLLGKNLRQAVNRPVDL